MGSSVVQVVLRVGLLLLVAGFASGTAMAQEQCEQSPFPVCDGVCEGANLNCYATQTAGCVCLPEPPGCQDTPYPECNGQCPPGEGCVPDDAGESCGCLPVTESCEQSPYPVCDGDCPTGTECYTTLTTCECLDAPPPCEQSPFPECLGPCPQGLVCETDPSGQAFCRCVAPPVPCEQSPYPVCDGECPAGTQCFTTLDTCQCLDAPPPCEQGPFPECLGPCPQGLVCETDPSGQAFCRCVAPPVPCEQSPYPVCDGECPAGTQCFTTLDTCQCLDAPPPCEQGPFPECLGPCPQGLVCETDPSGQAFCRCVAPPVPCEQSPYPVCDGECPAGTQCYTTLDTCQCLDAPPPCEQSPFPECLGPCPQGLVCETDPSGQAFCRCVAPPVPCEQSAYPVCDGECPAGTQCYTTLDTCQCLDAPPPCEQGPFPECDGPCPPGLACEPDPAGDACLCLPPPVACEQSTYPVCDGECPLGTHCDAATGAVLPTPDLPPEPDPPDCDRILSMYEGRDVHALFPGGIDFSQPQHKCFQNVTRQDDGQGNEIETFDSIVEGMVDLGSGPMPATLAGPVSVAVFGKTGNTTGTFQTEMVSMSLTGNLGGIPVEIRESPSLASAGQTTITDLGGGLWQIDSFFDVFTELSVDGGPFQPQLNDPGRMTLVPVTPGQCECMPDVVACENSGFPVCDGECPVGTTCVENPDGTAGCVCETPPVACDASAFPVCDGECPAGTNCVADDSTGACACMALGPCTQCGPGPHFIDQCGPFPPVGTDLVANNGALVGVDFDFDCVRDINLVLRPCPAPNHLLRVDKTLGPIDDSANFPGTSPVDGHPTGPGLDVIDTEIVAMCLTNGVVTLAAGAGGPSVLPLQRTLGTVAEDETTPDPTQGDSFFDVFFEVSGVPGGPVYNQTALRVRSVIDCLPPAANYQHPRGTCLPLSTRGVCVDGGAAGNPCINDLDCPDGACTGQVTVANLVSANHSVNQPVCDDSEFPECLGDCPPDEECVPDAATDRCHCEPVSCEQGEFPTCDGPCPPGLACEPDPAGDACLCLPPPVTCEDSEYPVCDGECPLGTHCDAATGAVLPTPDLPPEPDPPDCDRILSMYEGRDVHALFPGGIDFSQPQHKCFQNVTRQDDGQGNEIETFDSIVEGMVDLGSGPMPATLTGPVSVAVFGKTGNTTGTFQTEMVSMSLTGNLGGIPVEIRESPSLASAGQTTITDLGGGLWQIDSFFDVFTELSVDGGPFQPQLNDPGRMTLVPVTPGQCECVPDLVACENSGFPVCDGECPVGTTCVENPDGTAGCVCETPPVACDASAFPVCDGECPPGEECVSDDAGNSCFCGPAPVSCEESPYPECDGECPVGTQCYATFIGCECLDEPPPCDEGEFPGCLAACPPCLVCSSNPDGTEDCRCVEPPPLCEDSVFPVCDGDCPPWRTCQVTDDGECRCLEPLPACEDRPFPVCNGECPPDQRCVADLSGTDACRCEPVTLPCDLAEHPVCDGECPSHLVCEPGATDCRCVPPTEPCDSVDYPACGGDCPGDLACAPSGNGVCECLSLVPVCGDGELPTCEGECPPGEACIPGADACECSSVLCEETEFAICNGVCDEGQECVPIPELDGCRCQSVPAQCGETVAPVCDGECPPDEACVHLAGGETCECRPCVDTVPPGTDIDLFWPSTTLFRWSPGACARTYNVYRFTGVRLPDADNNGVADTYGTCLFPDIPCTFASDPSTPLPGETHFYVVSGENAIGEGAITYTWYLQQHTSRPNVNPCP